MRIYTLIILLFFSFRSFSQHCHISGSVTDSRHQPITGVTVSYDIGGYKTGFDGRFSIIEKRGIYHFVCTHADYETQQFDSVNCNGDSMVLNFTLVRRQKKVEPAMSDRDSSDINNKGLIKQDVSVNLISKSRSLHRSKGENVSTYYQTESDNETVSISNNASGLKKSNKTTSSGDPSVSNGHQVENFSQNMETRSLVAHKTVQKEKPVELAKPIIIVQDKANKQPDLHPGMLTSGEINDFSKWQLWNDLNKEEFEQFSKDWGFYPRHRYMIEVTNQDGFPICGAVATLYDRFGHETWKASTDNTGKAELWPDMFEYDTTRIPEYSIKVSYEHEYKLIPRAAEFPNGSNRVELEAKCGISNDIDIVFTVDATGSMGDEIDYLKTELLDVIRKISRNKQDLKINLGSVFYKDIGDDYLTKVSPLDRNIITTYNFIDKQKAEGGGDYPEAVDEALAATLDSINWHKDARAKIVFLILDAPPHDDVPVRKRLSELMRRAAEKGIRIVPLACSGVNKSTEYILRSFALATNGTYTFLTDHSGIGGEHIKPSTDKYKVENMNDLVLRLILQYSYYPDCKDFVTNLKKEEKDLLGKIDKNFALTDSSGHIQANVLDDPLNEDEFAKNIVIYPNPTRGNVTLEVKGGIEELFLTDLTGKILERYSVTKGDKLTIDIKDNAAGLYFIRYMKNEHWKAGKILLIKN